MTDIDTEGVARHTDLTYPLWTRMDSSEPNGGSSENCFVRQYGGAMSDVSCDSYHNYICEKTNGKWQSFIVSTIMSW